MGWVLANSFIDDGEILIENYSAVFDSSFMLQGFSNSLWLSFGLAVVGLLITTVLVSSLRRVDSKIREAVIAFTNMTSNFTGVPIAFAFIIILGINGTVTLLLNKYGLIDDFNLYGQWGLLVIYIYFQVPLAVLLLYPAFDGLNDDWQSAAALLDAKKWLFYSSSARDAQLSRG